MNPILIRLRGGAEEEDKRQIAELKPAVALRGGPAYADDQLRIEKENPGRNRCYVNLHHEVPEH